MPIVIGVVIAVGAIVGFCKFCTSSAASLDRQMKKDPKRFERSFTYIGDDGVAIPVIIKKIV